MTETVIELLQRGATAFKQKKFEDAERIFRKILENDPKNFKAMHNLGLSVLQLGKADEALKYLKLALETHPRNEQFWINYVGLLIKLRRTQDAESVLGQARKLGLKSEKLDQLSNSLNVSITPKNIQESIRQIITLFREGNKTTALSQAEVLAQHEPNNAAVLEVLANIQTDLNYLDEAEKNFKKSVSLQPLSSHAHYNFGNLLKKLSKFDEAIDCYLKSIKIKPDNAHAYNSLGSTYVEIDKLENAEKCFQKAVELDPKSHEAYNNLGNIQNARENFNAAVDYFSKAIEIKKDYPKAINNLAASLMRCERYLEAKEQYLLLKDPYYSGNILECLYSSGEYDQFQEMLSTLIQSDRHNIRVAAVSSFFANQLKIEDAYPFCKNPIEYFTLENVNISTSDNNISLEKILEDMEVLQKVESPLNKTTVKGERTVTNLFEIEVDSLRELELTIRKAVLNFYDKFKEKECELIKSWPEKFKLNGWFVRLTQHGYQKPHIHPSGWISGVLYLKTINEPKNMEGAIKLSLHGYNLPILDANIPEIIHCPIPGDLILFPSSLFHSTIPVEQQAERCVIAFDIMPLA